MMMILVFLSTNSFQERHYTTSTRPFSNIGTGTVATTTSSSRAVPVQVPVHNIIPGTRSTLLLGVREYEYCCYRCCCGCVV